MEACTLSLYDKNIFRITELPVDATAKDVSRQAQKQQMLAEMGHNITSVKAPFAPVHFPDEDQIREALARMKIPEDRIVDEFFWFWPEEFGNSKADPAIQAMLSGDSEKAAKIWREAEKGGSFTAIHNLAIMFHMAAVDWTIHQLKNVSSWESFEEVKGYWQRSFDRWEKVAEMEEIWDCMKDRLKSMDDEALTTGFIRRMRNELPMALDRVNAEAALAFAEKGGMEWAEYHVRLMNETHQGLDDVEATAELVLEPTRKRVRQYVNSAEQKASGNRAKGIELVTQLLEKCRPLMGIYDLFHGKEAHQRADLFDEVASTSNSLAVWYQIETEDNSGFVKALQATLDFVTGESLREQITKNISIGNNNIDLENSRIATDNINLILKKINSFSRSDFNPLERLSWIKSEILPMLPPFASSSLKNSTKLNSFLDSIAQALHVISVEAHNKRKDFSTALSAIEIGLKLVVTESLNTRLKADLERIKESIENSICHFCEVTGCKSTTSLRIEMEGNISGNGGQKTEIIVPRCDECKHKHAKAANIGCMVGIVSIIIGTLIGGLVDARDLVAGGIAGAVVGLVLSYGVTAFLTYSSGYTRFKEHRSVRKLISKGWKISKESN